MADLGSTQHFFGAESGGEDTMELGAPAPYPSGPELPGVPMGITGADIMQGMAQADPMVFNWTGTESDQGGLNLQDTAVSAGFHLTGGEPTQGTPVTGAMPAPAPASAGQAGVGSGNDGSNWADF